MEISLKPELERFLNQQVQSGHFTSTAEALEAGIARLMLDPEPQKLDENDRAEIQASLEEMRRGEVIDWREHSAKLRGTYLK